MNGGFSEAKTGTVQLWDDGAFAVTLFIQWLYTGDNNTDDNLHWSRLVFIKAWIFGDKIRCPGFQNWAITHLIKLIQDDNIVETRTLHLIFEESFSDSKLRILAIDQLRWVLRRGGLSRKEDYPEYMTLAREFDAFGIDYLKSCPRCQNEGKDGNVQMHPHLTFPKSASSRTMAVADLANPILMMLTLSRQMTKNLINHSLNADVVLNRQPSI